jgi:hypothetical protein
MPKVNKKDLPKAPIEEDFSSVEKTRKELKSDRELFLRKLAKEPKVKFFGDKLYQPFMGTVYTFAYNGYPITVRFDGTYQEFPETIANVIRRKLNAVSDANTRKEIEQQIQGF